MSTINETATITTKINGEQAEQQLNKLQKEAESLRLAISKAYNAGDTKNLKKFEKQLRDNTRESSVLKKSLFDVNTVLKNLSGSSVKDLNRALRQMNGELSSGKIKRGTKEWDEHVVKIKQVKRELNRLRAEQTETQGMFSRMAGGFNKFGASVLAIGAAITGISMTLRRSAQDAAHMDDVYSDVMKTTGLTRDQVLELNDSFKKMDTRTSRENLNLLARDAGKLGISGKENLMQFVEGANEIKVALGEDLGEDAIKQIGKMAEVYSRSSDILAEKDLKGKMLAVGSAVNELGASSTASEPYLVAFAGRLGGVATQAGLSMDAILGFGSALDQDMQAVEMSATALQKFIMKLMAEPAKFAKLAGLDVKNFSELLKTDANSAIKQVLSSLNEKGGLQALIPVFKDMGLDGARAVGVLSSMAGSIDKIDEAQRIANKAMTEGVSITNEYNIKNNNMQAQLEKAKKGFLDASIALGESLSPIMLKSTKATTYLVKALSQLGPWLKENRGLIIALVSAGAAYTVMLTKSIIVDKLKFFWNQKIVASFKQLWTTLAKNPYMALAAVMVVLIGLAADYIRKNNAITQSQKSQQAIAKKTAEQYDEQAAHIDSLNDALHNEKLSLGARKKALEELRSIVPGYHADLTAEGKLINDNVAAIDNYLAALEKEIRFKAAKEEREELFRAKRLQEKEVAQAQKGVDYAEKNVAEQSSNMSGTESSAAAMQAYATRAKTASSALEEKKKVLKETADAIAILNDELKEADTVFTSTTTKEPGSGGGYDPDAGDSDVVKTRLEAIDKQLAAERAKYAVEYSIGLKNKANYDEAINDAELIAIGQKIVIYEKGSKERLQLEEQYNLKLLALEATCTEAELQITLEGIRLEREALTKRYVQGEMDFAAYQEVLRQMDYKELVEKAKIYKEGTEEYKKAQQAVTDWLNTDQLNKRKSYEQDLASIRKEYSQQSNAELMMAELRAFEELCANIIIAEEEKQRIIAGIRKKYNNGVGGGNGLSADSWKSDVLNTPKNGFFADLIGNDIDLVKQQFNTIDQWAKESGATTAEVFQQKSEAIGGFLSTSVDKYQSVISQVSAITNAMASYVAASYEAQEAKVNSRYESEIKAAGKNKRKITQLEEAKEKELAALKAEASEKAFGIQVAQAIAGTAMSAIAAYSSAAAIPVVGYVLGPIAAGMAVAAGAIQIATIAKQRETAKASYWSGGYTPSGKWDEEQGVVHSDEFVANRFATGNKSLRPVLDLFNTAQKNNTIGNLTSEDVSRVVGTTGSSSGASRQSDNGASAQMQQSVSTLARATDRLNKQLDKGITSIVSITGRNGFEEEYNRYLKLMDNKKRKE